MGHTDTHLIICDYDCTCEKCSDNIYEEICDMIFNENENENENENLIDDSENESSHNMHNITQVRMSDIIEAMKDADATNRFMKYGNDEPL